MKNKPDIKTAIPRRRYSFGEFNVVILGDVESVDATEYRYILAVVREGDPEPGVYLTAERNRDGQAGTGAYAMRIIMADGSQVLDTADEWSDLDRFAADGLTVVSRLLNLGDQEAFRLA